MKRIFLNAIAITGLFALMSNACEDAVDDLTLDTPLDIEESFEVKFDEAGQISKFFDTEKNSDIEKYKGKIKSLKWTKITYKIEPLDGNEATVASVTIKYSAVGSQTGKVLIDNLNLLSTANTNKEISVDAGLIDALSKLYFDDAQMKVYVDGESDGPAKAKITLRFVGELTSTVN